ncbi:hypothetical protein PISMIDRAFT_686332, partial [Pisolithus microcarpus 441]
MRNTKHVVLWVMDEGVLHVPAMRTFGFENYSVRGRSHAPSAARSLHRAKHFVTRTWETRHTVCSGSLRPHSEVVF